MGLSVHILGNKDQTKMAVIIEEDLAHNGGNLTALELFKILKNDAGSMEHFSYLEIKDEDFQDPFKAVWGCEE